jgi:hypothetical protein
VRPRRDGVELAFTELRADGTVSATFSFFNLPGRSNAAEGKFNLNGRYDLASGSLSMTPGAWIRQPAGYFSAGFSAVYRPPARTIAGTISNTACGQITVTKIGN